MAPIDDEKNDTSPSGVGTNQEVEHASHAKNTAGISRDTTHEERLRLELNKLLADPLARFSVDELAVKGEEYARQYDLGTEEDVRAFRFGAMLAKNVEHPELVKGMTEEEMAILEYEKLHRWSQPKSLYLIILLCSLCAAVQGMDETVVNGAQIFYSKQFGIGDKSSRSTWLVGLLNSAPYLCCAFIGCWLTIPFNKWFGRRGTVFLTCVFSALACFWQAFTNTWWHMFIARFALGLGIGPKSATVPIYAAECSPYRVRGGLVMFWQFWTAFGIAVGYFADLAFYYVPDKHNITGLNWRLMMGSAMLPAVIVCLFVFMCPESPRWYMTKARHREAYSSMCKIRVNKIQAARDIFIIHTGLEAEKESGLETQNPIKEMVKIGRNRRAMIASELVMFMQQFCGVNVIAYYSSEIFVDAGFPEINALGASAGFGVINFLFAIPAIYTIDTFGRRNLLLTTFPLMSLALFFTGFSFWIPSDSKAHVGCIALGIYLFGIVYSPGEGPVPFTYSAEAYPLYIRPQGMALATATTWFFNFVLSITWPSLLKAFKPQGAFSWYAVWNLIGWVGILLFMPETKGKELEELDRVFSIPTRIHAKWGLACVPYFIQRYVFRRPVDKPVLMGEKDVEYHEDSFRTETEHDPEKRV